MLSTIQRPKNCKNPTNKRICRLATRRSMLLLANWWHRYWTTWRRVTTRVKTSWSWASTTRTRPCSTMVAARIIARRGWPPCGKVNLPWQLWRRTHWSLLFSGRQLCSSTRTTIFTQLQIASINRLMALPSLPKSLSSSTRWIKLDWIHVGPLWDPSQGNWEVLIKWITPTWQWSNLSTSISWSKPG